MTKKESKETAVTLRGIEPLILSFLNESDKSNQSLRKIGLGVGFSYNAVKKALLHLEGLNCVERVFEKNRFFPGLSFVPSWTITEFGQKVLESHGERKL